MKSKKSKTRIILDQLRMMAGYSSAESFHRFGMKPSDPPGVNAHTCAPDASTEWLASLGFNPEEHDEDALNIALALLEVGYCIGSAASDERQKDELESFEVISEELKHLRKLLTERSAQCTRLDRQLQEATSHLVEEGNSRRLLQADNCSLREKLSRISTICES